MSDWDFVSAEEFELVSREKKSDIKLQYKCIPLSKSQHFTSKSAEEYKKYRPTLPYYAESVLSYYSLIIITD